MKNRAKSKAKHRVIDFAELLKLADERIERPLTDRMEDILIETNSNYIAIGDRVYAAEDFLTRIARVELSYCRESLKAACNKWVGVGFPEVAFFSGEELTNSEEW